MCIWVVVVVGSEKLSVAVKKSNAVMIRLTATI